MIVVGRMVLVVVLTLVGALPVLAQDESSTPEPASIDLRLNIPGNEDVPPQLVATVRDADGTAISGLDVDFTRELRFLGTDRLAPLGSSTTDVGGVARLVVLPRQEQATVVARVAGTDVGATIDATFPENRVDTFFDPTHEHGLLTPLTQGDVTIPLTMTGAPGWHFIDLYPAIYKGEEPRGRNNFRIPQLTALDDHPGEDLPIYRYAFYIEG